jgi:hypothetical protein
MCYIYEFTALIIYYFNRLYNISSKNLTPRQDLTIYHPLREMTTPVLPDGVKSVIDMHIETGLQKFKELLNDAVLKDNNKYEQLYPIYTFNRESDIASYNVTIEEYIRYQLARVKCTLNTLGNEHSDLPVVCLKCLPYKLEKSHTVYEMGMRVYLVVHPSNAVRYVVTKLSDCVELSSPFNA